MSDKCTKTEKVIPVELGGFNISDLLRVIADDYRHPKTAQIVRDVRGLWLDDLAALLESKDA